MLPITQPLTQSLNTTTSYTNPNPYPTSYQYFQMQQPTFNTRPSNVIWVQGESGAKSYQVYPNSPMILMDSESKHFFIKSADNAGIPSLKRYRFEEEPIEGSPDALLLEAKKETEDLKKTVADLQKQIAELKTSKPIPVVPSTKSITQGDVQYVASQPNIVPTNAIIQQPTQQYSPSVQPVPQIIPGQP